MTLPQVTRVYQNHHLDSTRWEVYTPRPDDIIVTTAYKSGTTWTQDILFELISGDTEPLPDKDTLKPWPDADFIPIDRDTLKASMEAITSQRMIKSHLPLDGLPYYKEARYVIVCRDPRDVFMSFFNHYSRYTDTAFEMLNDPARLKGEPLQRCPEDPRVLWQDWITRGWFEWESEGYPFWSNLHHTQSYWDYRHLPNFLFLHYNDMLENLDGSVRKLAAFCDIKVDDEKVARVVEATTFANVKKKVEAQEDDDSRMMFKDGNKGFFFKGNNGRWRDVLTSEDLKLYEEAKERVLTADCAKWLEEGGELPR